MILKFIFWISIFVILYTYVIYTILLIVIYLIKILFFRTTLTDNKTYNPEVTLLIAAYNEKKCIEQKVNNTLELDYPSSKLKVIWVTDGSNDGSEIILSKYKSMEVLHQKERKGKIDAINRAIKYVKSPIVIFSDANTCLNKDAVKELVKYFTNPEVGCVAGEKRIIVENNDMAVSSGEGIYWKYESLIKNLESKINSTLAAAGELYAIRTELFEEIPSDCILDDFNISLRIVLKKYKIKYSSKAFAYEAASASINEELKRKIRIASGSFQTLFRTVFLLNFVKYGFLSFQYISHKVLRWLLVPFALIFLFFSNLLLLSTEIQNKFFLIFFLWQISLYAIVLLGAIFRNYRTKIKFIFLPYYLFMMNFSILIGLFRYMRGKHSVIWDKAQRKEKTGLY